MWPFKVTGQHIPFVPQGTDQQFDHDHHSDSPGCIHGQALHLINVYFNKVDMHCKNKQLALFVFPEEVFCRNRALYRCTSFV